MSYHSLPQLISTSVIANDQRYLLPWTITRFSDTSSVIDFFLETVKPRLENDCCLLQSALVGHDKHSLDLVDISLPLIAVVSSFGRFLQFKITLPNNDVSMSLAENVDTSLSFIQPINERNRKDTLYNRVISFFNSSSVGLLEEEMLSGKKLVALL